VQSMTGVFTFQIGTGEAGVMHVTTHAETFSAVSLIAAIQVAKRLTRTAHAETPGNVVRILEEFGGDYRVMWFHPKDMILAAADE